MNEAYQYDLLGRRTHKSGTGVTDRLYLNDGSDEIVEYDATKSVVAYYVPGPAIDEPIAIVTGTASAYTHAYFHTNHQGSVIATTADDGTKLEGPFNYDPYGTCYFSTTTTKCGTPSTSYRFTGRRLDTETGLLYYRARYYDPAKRRFLQTDPVGYNADLNLYTYVGNDPTDKDDPSGKCEPFCGLIIGAIVGAGLEVAQETIVEGKSFTDVSASRVAAQAGIGALAGATGAGIGTLAEKGAAVFTSRAVAGAVGEVTTGAVTGAVQSGANGESILKGAVYGAAGGVVGAKVGQATEKVVDRAAAAVGQKLDNALAKAGDLGAQLRQTGAMSGGQSTRSVGSVVGGFAQHGADAASYAYQKLSHGGCTSSKGKPCT